MSTDLRFSGGIYGKVPSFADFVHRGLPRSFVEPWNKWLERSLARSRELISERWTDAYLTSPVWRFALDPTICGERAWLGVIASSVDEVRRCYPITIALPLPGSTRLSSLVEDLEPLFEAMERILLNLIDGAETPDSAMSAVAGLVQHLPPPAAVSLWSRGGKERLRSGAVYPSLAAMAADLGSSLDERATPPLSAWWHAGWNENPPASLATIGLPSPDLFACFLDGAWRERGWSALGAA